MSDAEKSQYPRIELDLGGPVSAQGSNRGRIRQVSQDSLVPLPPIVPTMNDFGVGGDELERMVGILFLLSALPGVISLLLGHGPGGLLGIAIPLYFGIGLLRGDAFVRRFVIVACVVQIIASPLSALVSPRSVLYIIGGVAQSSGLLVMILGGYLSKTKYMFCIGIVVVGFLTGFVGSFLH